MKYLYCVIGSVEPEDKVALTVNNAGGEIYTIPYKDIACVVSDSSGLNLGLMEKENIARFLIAHQSVIEKVMKNHTMIPIKFGTELKSAAEVGKVMERGYPEFLKRLNTFTGKIEIDVTAIWNDLEGVIRLVGEEDKDIRDFKAAIASRPPQETFADRIKIGSMIKDALDKKRGCIQDEMLEHLRKEAVDVQTHEITDDTVILNGAFLVDKKMDQQFYDDVDELNERYEEKINFKCVSPLPPYSFSTMEINKVGYDEIDRARSLLRLGEKATKQEIKESYHKMAREYHPDKDPDNPGLNGRFGDITKAYKLLYKYCSKDNCSFKAGDFEDFFFVEAMKI